MFFKEGKQFDSWHHSTMALACAQDIAEILSPSHVPVTQDDKDLFKEKQKYMFAVSDCTLLTDTDKALVCEHKNDFDTQKVYAEIVKFYLKSTKASLDSSNLLSYITSVHLGSGIWKGSTYSFILHWQDQVCLYEKQIPATDHFSDGHKQVMLQNAVLPVMDLQNVKNLADQHKTQSRTDLTYEQYCNLLLSAASAYDASFVAKEALSLQPKNWVVYLHDIVETESYDAQEDVLTYDIDVPVNTLQAQVHQQRIPSKPP